MDGRWYPSWLVRLIDKSETAVKQNCPLSGEQEKSLTSQAFFGCNTLFQISLRPSTSHGPCHQGNLQRERVIWWGECAGKYACSRKAFTGHLLTMCLGLDLIEGHPSEALTLLRGMLKVVPVKPYLSVFSPSGSSTIVHLWMFWKMKKDLCTIHLF